MTKVRLIRPVYDKPKYERAVYKKMLSALQSVYRQLNSNTSLISNSTGDLDFTVILKALIGSLDFDLRQSMKDLTILPALSKTVKEFVAREYSRNLKYGIKKFTDQQIRTLRLKVEEMHMTGARREDIAKVIKASYGVAERKARFLARQETNLLTAKLKEARYREAGIDEYYWVSVKGTVEHPVRPVHKELNARSEKGETFSFSDPPKSGTKGEKQNPQEPFGCRCIARPVIRK